MNDDATLLAQLRRMWDQVDPAPEHLADHVLFALELDSLDSDFELMRLIERDDATAGARAPRGARSEVTHITFAGESRTVMLAVAHAGHRRRVDGWIAPAARSRVVALSAEGQRETVADRTGRFVLEDVPAGMLRLALFTAVSDDGTVARFVTPTVEV